MPTPTDELEALFRDTNTAHHHAFAATDGADPEWARWYAQYLSSRVASLLGPGVDVARLASELVALDAEYRREQRSVSWQAYYARWFIARYARAAG